MKTRSQVKREREWENLKLTRMHLHGPYSVQELIYIIANHAKNK